MNITAAWKRVKICGRLQVLSPLHIGDGTTVSETREQRDADKAPQTALVNQVCCTSAGVPYLPASSLRGALRARSSGEVEAALFGNSREEGGMGKLRCYDALARSAIPLQRRTGIAMNHQFGVVEPHKLFTNLVVPVGTEFSLEVEADDLCEAELSSLLGLLGSLDGPPGSGLGAGKSKDQGRLQWSCDRVDTISAEQLAQWVVKDEVALPWAKLATIPAPQAPESKAGAIAFTVEFESPWLVDDPELHEQKKDAQHNPPHLEFSRTAQGQAVLPASSFKGWLRGQARCILKTLLVNGGQPLAVAEVQVERRLSDIFGDTRKAAWLRVSDAISELPVHPHLQQFNAIDRFTGGGKEGALYCANAAPPVRLKGHLALSSALPSEPDWRLGLLAFVARDAMEGDLRLGWGKSRGYGCARLHLHLPDGAAADWSTWVARFGNSLQPHIIAFQQWIQATEVAHG